MTCTNYTGNILLIFFLFIIATVGGSYIIYLIKQSYCPSKVYEPDQDGMLERFLIFFCMVLGGDYYKIIPFIIIIRILVLYKKYIEIHLAGISDIAGMETQKIRIKFCFYIEAIISPLMAILLGLFFRSL
ncbi:MAG: hypothetical protein ABIA63_07965 [bacterium]